MDSSLESVLLEYSQDKVIVVDETGELRYANAALERIYGYDPDEMIGESAFDLVHPEDVEETRACFERVISADEPTTETRRYRGKTAEGETIWIESRFSNVTDDSIGGYVFSSRDVTEQVRSEREREIAEERLAEMASTVGDVLWIFDADWSELLFVNPAYEDVFGGSVDELEDDPRTFIDAIHPEDRDRVREVMARMSDGESLEIEYRVNPARDYDRWVWVKGEPVEKDGEVVRIVGFTRDVTDRRRRERQLTVMDNLLRHNIRNDMSIVNGQAEMIVEEGDDDAAHRAAIIRSQGQALIESAEKQREIIELLTSPAIPGRLNLAEIVSDAIEHVHDRHPDVTIDVDVPEGLAVEALGELEAAVAELLENAIEHDPDGDPRVTVSAHAADDAVELVIDDESPPIPEVEYRVLTGDWLMDEVYHTSGLGLWLVYWVVDLSDGDVTFSRHEPNGNTVRIALPHAAPASSE
jgi:PAS domain S-box-containing protein